MVSLVHSNIMQCHTFNQKEKRRLSPYAFLAHHKPQYIREKSLHLWYNSPNMYWFIARFISEVVIQKAIELCFRQIKVGYRYNLCTKVVKSF